MDIIECLENYGKSQTAILLSIFLNFHCVVYVERKRICTVFLIVCLIFCITVRDPNIKMRVVGIPITG